MRVLMEIAENNRTRCYLRKSYDNMLRNQNTISILLLDIYIMLCLVAIITSVGFWNRQMDRPK